MYLHFLLNIFPQEILNRNIWLNYFGNLSVLWYWDIRMRTWTCRNVLYLLFFAVYFNQVSSFSFTYSSALIPGGWIGGEVIAISSMFLPVILTFITWFIFEEITGRYFFRWNKSCLCLWDLEAEGGASVLQLQFILSFLSVHQLYFNHRIKTLSKTKSKTYSCLLQDVVRLWL